MIYWVNLIYEAAIKLSNLRRLCFIAVGYFLLLNPSPDSEDSGICQYSLTSPVFPGSEGRCFLQVALYEASPAAGNLTLLIKAVLSGSTVQSVILNHTSHDDHRSANIHVVPLWCCLYRIVLYLHYLSPIKLVTEKQNPASLLIEVPVKLWSP